MLALALSLATAVGPAADPAPAAVCPTGDTPTGVVAELVHTRRTRSLEVTEGHGVLTFVDVIENRSDSAAEITLSLGTGGVVRAASVEQPGLAPRAARLDDVHAAEALFDGYREALTRGVPADEAHDGAARAALLVTHAGWDSEPAVTVLVPCSVRSATVRVEMLLPSLPVDGAWQFAVPGTPGEGVGDTIIVDSNGPIRAFLEDQSVRPGDEIAVPTLLEDDEDGALTVTARPLSGPRLRARGYAIRVAPTAAPRPPDDDEDAVYEEGEPIAPVTVARAELDLPKPLATAPAGLRFVFVVDNSVSVGEDGLAKAMQMVDAILDELPPDARFAVVTAGRRPRVVVAPWSERDVRDIPAIALENGSDVLAALQKARAIAADVDDGQVARIVAVSDMQLRFVDDDAAVARGFGGASAPVTHLVSVAHGAVEQPFLWSRSFSGDDPRAAGPESTGGIWVDAGDEEEAALFPHLVAPTRLDKPRVTLGGADALADATVVRIDDDDYGYPSENELPLLLPAGSGLRVEVALDAEHPGFARRDLRVGGLLWAEPLDLRVTNDERLLGLAAVTTIGGNLDDALVRTIARRAGTVSRVTALVEVPDFRPAEPELGGGMGFGCSCGCGCCGGLGGRGYGSSIACGNVDLRERETLEALLREDARACLVPRAILDVEFGDEEILEIHERAGGTCVAERFWKRRLDHTPRTPGAFVNHREMTVGID